MPIECFTEWEDSVFFGTADGRVMRMNVPVDNALLDPPNPAFNGDDIEFSILTAFSNMGTDGICKNAKLIRPDFLSTLPPSHTSQMRWDFDVAEGINFSIAPPTGFEVGLWDVSIWDQAIWGSSTGVTWPTIGGTFGYGRYGAVATKGTCRSDTRLIGWDVIYDTGGPMI